MGKIIICGSCGAEFDEDLAKCPYCGSVNIKGAEREYMGKLEDVRKGMGELENTPVKELQDTVKKQGNFLRKAIVALLAITAAAAIIVFVGNRGEKRDYREEYLWQQEYFPQLSALYENGEYDAMLKLAEEALSGNPYSLSAWEHYSFYEAYFSANEFEELLRDQADEKLYEFGYVMLFYNEWQLVCLKEFAGERAKLTQSDYTEEEWEVLAPYIERAREELTQSFRISEKEYQDFLQLAADNYFRVPYDRCEEYIEQWLKDQN